MNNYNLRDKILSEIRAGRVHMTPRAVYALQIVALAAIVGAILTTTVFIVNFIFFSIRISSYESLLWFGPNGFLTFLYLFPWPLAIADGALVVLLQWLLRKFRFGYLLPVLYIVAAVILGAGVLGFILDRATTVNDRLFEGRERLPPPLHQLYDGARHLPPEQGVCRCEILSVKENVLVAKDTHNTARILTIVLPHASQYATTSGLHAGDIVFVAGREKDGLIEAFGVRREPPRD